MLDPEKTKSSCISEETFEKDEYKWELVGVIKTEEPKQEECKWCKAGIPENCIEQSDLLKQ